VFCATPHLATVYAELNPNVHLLRNGVLEADWRRVRVPGEDGKVRIGWAAGRQHEPDAEIIGPALRSIKKKHGDTVDIRVVGLDPKWDFEYEARPFTPTLATYRDELAEFDISLAPLKRNEMNQSKSDLKWLESSMAGTAFVCTDYEPYETVEHGVTGLKCESRNDWFDAIDSLVANEGLRTEMSEQARMRVLSERGSERTSVAYRDALSTIRSGMRIAA
jgi:glycosyltransferase involved in cell wall biosynthesis